MPEFEALRSLWTPHEHLKAPPLEPINLWGEGGVGIWVSNDWGPAVPYSGVDHRDGNINHGYRPMKGNEAAIRFIPEVQGWPEMQKFLETINAESSPIESVGCEKGIFPSDVEGLQIKLGSYVDVIFTEAVLNDRPDNFLLLATFLANAIEGCEKWWASVSLVLQRNKALVGATTPWGLIIRPQNYGRTEEEARKFWGYTLSRLGNAVSDLPLDFGLKDWYELAVITSHHEYNSQRLLTSAP